MTALQFTAAIVESLAWPTVAVVLGLLFRRSIIGLLKRVLRLRFPGGEAELAATEHAAALQRAVQEASKPLPPGDEEATLDRIEVLMREAAAWGFATGQMGIWEAVPVPEIRREGEQVRIDFTRPGVGLSAERDIRTSFDELPQDERARAVRLLEAFRRARSGGRDRDA